MEASESLEWRQARQWLIVSGVIPPTHKVTKPDVDLVDFARSLRDGVFLCSFLLKLKPDCIQESDWNGKPLMQVYTTSYVGVYGLRGVENGRSFSLSLRLLCSSCWNLV
jgi:guanine nucleotide exchange factor VAV